MADHKYTADTIKSLDWKEHIRLRPGMYIGKLGDGSSEDEGIYVLMKEVLDNCIDEFVMGFGKQIEVESDGQKVEVPERVPVRYNRESTLTTDVTPGSQMLDWELRSR